MAVPSYYASDFFYKQYTATDINDWIAAIRDILTVQLPVASRWTESPAGTFTSPTDAGGRFMKLVLVRSSATLGTHKIIDRFGNNITEGFLLSGAGQNLEVSGGPNYLVTWLTDGTSWTFHSLADPSPEAMNAMTNDTFEKSRRASGGGDNSFPTLPDRGQSVNPDSIAGYSTRFMGPWFIGSAAGPQLATAGGSLLFLPVTAPTYPVADSTLGRVVGHHPQLVWCDQNQAGIFNVPLDVGITGQFKQIAGLGQQGTGFATQAGKLAARVG